MKILVTGGAGFIGSHFVKYILNRYLTDEVLTLDVLTYAGNLKNLSECLDNPRHTFVKKNILDVETLDGIDIVVHFAAETHVDNSIRDASNFISTNITGTYNLLEKARKAKITKFIYISTDEVYGSILEGRFTESSPLHPNNPYSASKAAAEHLVYSYYKTYGLPIVITRSSNNYGTHQYPEKMIPFFIKRALQNQPIPLYGDGLNVRDWLYVEDNCKGIARVLEKGRIGEVYNIGANNEYTNLEVVRFLLDYLKSDVSIQFVEDRPGHDRRYALDTAKIREELGWKPEAGFVQSLIETIDWYVTEFK